MITLFLWTMCFFLIGGILGYFIGNTAAKDDFDLRSVYRGVNSDIYKNPRSK